MSKKLTTEEFINRSIKVHGNKYDYSEVVYITARIDVNIICHDHGLFSQNPSRHMGGAGCTKCQHDSARSTSKVFIEKAKKVHGAKYDYSKVNYTRSLDKVEILCKTHGTFHQTPKNHLKGNMCPVCSIYGDKTKNEWFVAKAREAHGDLYNYSLLNYINGQDKVQIICRHHGTFTQTAYTHLAGAICMQCSHERSKLTTDTFIEKAKEIHSNTYDYSGVEYKLSIEPVDIICKVHGIFSQKPCVHLTGSGCPECKVDATRMTTKGFIEKANIIHNSKYDYSKTHYMSNKKRVTITCPAHGDFEQVADYHMTGRGCAQCGLEYYVSKAEDKLVAHIRSIGFEVQQSNRTLISPLELDIVIPDKKIAIEYNGVRWHSEKFGKDKRYHKNKTNLCKDKGYRLIHIWEDDFNKDPQKELDFISYSLGVSSQDKVYARKTNIEIIPNKLGKEFLDKHHIQGSGVGSIYYGTYYEEELLAVTSFLVRKDLVELTRHSSDRQILGGLGKVTKFASKALEKDIISFCDLSRFDGKSYLACGYEVVKEIPPDYKYLVGNTRDHKFNWRKARIKVKLPDVYSPELTEKQMMELADIPRIWDCGKLKLIYKYRSFNGN